jgi:hypothetical protein
MRKELFVTDYFEPFFSAWGSKCVPTPYNDGFIVPIGWEGELTKRGIEFTEIEIKEDESRDL